MDIKSLAAMLATLIMLLVQVSRRYPIVTTYEVNGHFNQLQRILHPFVNVPCRVVIAAPGDASNVLRVVITCPLAPTVDA